MADEFSYDVFLSHASADKPAVRELAQRLEGDGLRVWFDEWVIQPGDLISLKIEQGLESSRTLVLVMSEAAFVSEWATLERHTAFFRDPTNKQRRFIPLRLDDCEIKDSLKLFAYVDWREGEKREYQRLLACCTRDLPAQVQHAITFSRQAVERDGFPFEYGSDLHWFWGWGYVLRTMLDDDKAPSEYDWIIFRPCRQARRAMMRFSVAYPLVIKAVDDGLDFAEEMFDRFLDSRTDINGANFHNALDSLAFRIDVATEAIAIANNRK